MSLYLHVMYICLTIYYTWNPWLSLLHTPPSSHGYAPVSLVVLDQHTTPAFVILHHLRYNNLFIWCSIYLSVCLLSSCPFLFSFVCLSVHLSACLLVCMFVIWVRRKREVKLFFGIKLRLLNKLKFKANIQYTYILCGLWQKEKYLVHYCVLWVSFQSKAIIKSNCYEICV